MGLAPIGVKNTETQYVSSAAAREAERLFQATQRNIGVKRLAVNPLMLTILAIIQRQGIELPSHRIELFELCATTLLETWIKAKGLTDANPFSKNELIKILRPLAFWMHEHLAVGAIPEDDLIDQISHQLLDRKITRHEDDAIRLAKSFPDTVRGKTGILVERGKERYGFLHLTFEEYFAARELERDKGRNDFIKMHLHDARWREVILLAISATGILQSDEEDVTEIIETILQTKSPFEQWLHRDLLSAGRCLADDIGVNTEVENRIIENILYLYITSPYDSIRESFADVLSQWSETKVAAKAMELLLPLLYKQAKAIGIKMQPPKTLSSDNSLIERVTTHHQQRVQSFHTAQVRVIKLLIMEVSDILQPDHINYDEYAKAVLSEPHVGARASAIPALGQVIGEHSRANSVLFKLLSDPKIDVRLACIQETDHIKYNTPSYFSCLLSYVSDSSLSIWQAAVQALAPTHPAVLDALLSRLSDPSKEHPEIINHALTMLSEYELSVSNNDFIKQIGISQKVAEYKRNVDRETLVRLVQLMKLLGTGQPYAIEALLKLLASSNPKVKKATIEALGATGKDSPQVIDALLKLPTGNNVGVRTALVEALSLAGNDRTDVLDALLKSLTDANSEVRRAAVEVLGRKEAIQDQASIMDKLSRLLANSNTAAQQAIIETLGQLDKNNPQVIAMLFEFLSDDASTQQTAARILGQSGRNDPQIVDTLLEKLDTESNMRGILRALGQAGDNRPQVMEAILAYSKSSDQYIRQAAIRAMGQLGNGQPRIVQALLDCLPDRSENVNQAIAEALGQIGQGQPRVIQPLLKLLDDSSEKVRLAAAGALGKIGRDNTSVVQALLNRITDYSEKVIVAAIDALGQSGTGNTQVIQALLDRLMDSNERIRLAAADALADLSSDRALISERIADLLRLYEPIGEEQVAIDKIIDELLFALQQVTGEV